MMYVIVHKQPIGCGFCINGCVSPPFNVPIVTGHEDKIKIQNYNEKDRTASGNTNIPYYRLDEVVDSQQIMFTVTAPNVTIKIMSIGGWKREVELVVKCDAYSFPNPIANKSLTLRKIPSYLSVDTAFVVTIIVPWLTNNGIQSGVEQVNNCQAVCWIAKDLKKAPAEISIRTGVMCF